MSDYLQLTVRFLQPLTHARKDGDEPEWPPSPLRLFQALVSAAAARWNERLLLERAVPALRCLQEKPVAVIVACPAIASAVPTQFYVPDNTAELLVPSWKRGETEKGPKRTEKVVLPTHLNGEAVHYLCPIDNELIEHFDVLKSAARSITHLGWGIDMVAADAALISGAEADSLPGVRWLAAQSGGVSLRVPRTGTLDDLIRKHQDFLNRLSDDGFRPVPPLREFGICNYRPSTDIEQRPYCVFTILTEDASRNQSFNRARRTRDVAAWIRHAVGEICQHAGWPDYLPFVHGHGAGGEQRNTAENSSHRFQYLPLPTINSKLKRVEAIRRVMVVAPVGCGDRIDFIRKRLLGQELRWGNKVVGVLNVQPGKDWVRDQYVNPTQTWSTVTPVILDGFNDQNDKKTQKLICKALANAGISSEVEFDYQPFGFLAGVEPARDFSRPEKLNGSMIHVKLRFKHPVPGPIAIGAGRYRGFGLFVGESDSLDA